MDVLAQMGDFSYPNFQNNCNRLKNVVYSERKVFAPSGLGGDA